MKTRIISAIVLAIIAVPLLIVGGYPYYIGVGILAMLSYKEIIDLKKDHKPLPPLVIILGVICLSVLLLQNIDASSLRYGITYQSIVFVLLMLLVPCVFYPDGKYTTRDALYLIGVTLLLGLAFNLFIIIRNRGIMLVVYLFSITMITDTFAMIGGKYFGKNKLCPKISPKKTWEGSFVGLVAGTVVGVIIYSIWISHFSVGLVFITALLSIIGQIGDLILSKIKRENDIKDFSNIMPGHGGILDRFDSLIFVALTYLIVVFYL